MTKEIDSVLNIWIEYLKFIFLHLFPPTDIHMLLKSIPGQCVCLRWAVFSPVCHHYLAQHKLSC